MARLVRQRKTFYVDATGKRVPKGTPGASRQSEFLAKWYGQGIPGMPPAKRVPLATDKRVAQRMLNELVSAAERGIVGMPTADLGRADLTNLATEFREAMLIGLANQNRSAKKRPSEEQADLTTQRLRTVLEACRLGTVADLNDAAPAKVAKYLTGRVRLGTGPGGLSAQTAEFFRKAVGRFAWWLAIRKKAPVRADLFADVPAFDAKRDRVHLRRVLTHAELASVLDAARGSGVIEYDLTPEDRYFLYSTAVATGLRVSELASLTPESFRLDDAPPAVALEAKRAKNRTAAVIPLTPGLAHQIRDYLGAKPSGVSLWYGTWVRDNKGAEILRRDLKRAGVPYVVTSPEGPRHADFHALRHTFITSLADTGVNPKELQTLARHADAETTLNHYTHTNPDALAAAIGRLRLPGGAGQGNPLAGMTRSELESVVAGLLGAFGLLLGTTATQTTTQRRAA